MSEHADGETRVPEITAGNAPPGREICSHLPNLGSVRDATYPVQIDIHRPDR